MKSRKAVEDVMLRWTVESCNRLAEDLTCNTVAVMR